MGAVCLSLIHQTLFCVAEINDLASEQTAMVAELTAVLHQAGSSGYPPVEGSDGSPTSEAECAMVNKTGNWQPWV